MDVANPMVRVRVRQANTEVVVQGGATRVSFVIVWLAVSAALAKRRLRQRARRYVDHKHR